MEHWAEFEATAGPTRPDAAVPAGPDPWAAFARGPEPLAPEPTPTRRPKKVLIASVSALVVAAAVVIGMLAFGGSGGSGGSGLTGSGVAAADFVVSSTQTTLAQRTADVTFTGSVSADGQDVPMNGTGQVDFDTGSFSADLTENAASTSVAIRELIASGEFYFGMTINGQDMSTLTDGAQWVAISLPDQSSSNSLGAANVDPIGQLKALEQKGATVTSLGTQTIDGTSVSGYSVTPSRQEVENDLQQEIQQNQISPAEARQMLQAPNLLGTFTSDVWIDGSGLIRQEDVEVAGGSAGVAAKATVTFQNYGTPVSIAAPAPSDVVALGQFLDDLKTAGTTALG
jgi:hypothetical protein